MTVFVACLATKRNRGSMLIPTQMVCFTEIEPRSVFYVLTALWVYYLNTRNDFSVNNYEVDQNPPFHCIIFT